MLPAEMWDQLPFHAFLFTPCRNEVHACVLVHSVLVSRAETNQYMWRWVLWIKWIPKRWCDVYKTGATNLSPTPLPTQNRNYVRANFVASCSTSLDSLIRRCQASWANSVDVFGSIFLMTSNITSSSYLVVTMFYACGQVWQSSCV